MEQTYLEGRAMQGMASGRVAWWVIITGWFVLGGMAAIMLYIAATAGFWGGILPAALGGVLILIMTRGTLNKLKQQRR
jgi:hypothetical protein